MKNTFERISNSRNQHLEMFAAAYLKRTHLPAEMAILVERRQGNEIIWEFIPRLEDGERGGVRALVDQRISDFMASALNETALPQALVEKAMEVLANVRVERDELYRRLSRLDGHGTIAS